MLKDILKYMGSIDTCGGDGLYISVFGGPSSDCGCSQKTDV